MLGKTRPSISDNIKNEVINFDWPTDEEYQKWVTKYLTKEE